MSLWRKSESLKHRKERAISGEWNNLWGSPNFKQFSYSFRRLKKSTGEIWEFLHHPSILQELMSRDYWFEDNKFTIFSTNPIFQNLYHFCLSKSATQRDDGTVENFMLTEHEKRIKDKWEIGEADNRKIGRKCTREHNRARKHTLVIQKQVCSVIFEERGKWCFWNPNEACSDSYAFLLQSSDRRWLISTTTFTATADPSRQSSTIHRLETRTTSAQ